MMVRFSKAKFIEILYYLRAHCLLIYDGDISKIKMTEPINLDFEIIVLE